MTYNDEGMRRRASMAHEYAEHVRKTRVSLACAQDCYDDTAAALDGVKAVRYDRDGGAGTMIAGDDAMAAQVEKLQAARAELEAERAAWMAERVEFYAATECMDERAGKLLRMRYCHARAWAHVADVLGYSEDYVRHELREEALALLYDTMPHTWRERVPPAL